MLILGQMATSLLKASFLALGAQMLDFDSKMRPSANAVHNHPIFHQPLLVIFSVQENGEEEDVTEPLLSTSSLPSDEAADSLKAQHDDR